MDVNETAEIIPLPLKQGGTTATILRLVKSRADEKMEFLIAGLNENIAEALFEEMAGMDEKAKLAHHFNIMRAMKTEHMVYQDKFAQLMMRTWALFLKKMDDSHIAKPVGEAEKVINALSRKTGNHYKVLIQETRQRFQTLFKREIGRHPLCPDLYYRAFWQALAETSLGYEERLCVIALFHRFVMDRYGQILGEANRALVELKVDTTVVPEEL